MEPIKNSTTLVSANVKIWEPISSFLRQTFVFKTFKLIYFGNARAPRMVKWLVS